LSTNNQLETSITTASDRREHDFEEEKILAAKHITIDAMLEASRDEMRQISAIANELNAGINRARSDIRQLNRDRLVQRRENTIAEARTNTAIREHDAFANISECARRRLAHAKGQTNEMRDIVHITSDVLHATKTEVLSQVCVHKLSEYAVIQFLRFKHGQFGTTKDDRSINCPMEFDSKTLLNAAEPTEQYSLVGVVRHFGSVHRGHYTCVVRRSVSVE
jgi:hypothetical protein